MSVANLSSNTQYRQVDIFADNITCVSLNSEVLTILDIVTDDISTVGLILRAPPTIDNANNNVLVRNATTGEVELNTDIGLSNVSDGSNLGVGVPVFHAKNGTILEFNSLSANGAQGFSLTPAPGPGGDIVINNTFLDQSVTTTSSPSFNSSVTVSSTTTATLTLLASSVPTGTHLQYADGTFTYDLDYPALTANRTATLPDESGIIILDSATQTLTNKTLVNNTTSFIDGGDATKKILFGSSGATNSTNLTLASICTMSQFISFPDASGTLLIDTLPLALEGQVLVGTISKPKLFTYTGSVNTTANASFNVFSFTPPNTVDSQSIICNLEVCFYNKVTLASAYVKKTYTFTYIPGVSMNIAFTDVSIVDVPLGTFYFAQAAGNIGPDEIRIFVQPTNADSTDILLNFSFLCKV